MNQTVQCYIYPKRQGQVESILFASYSSVSELMIMIGMKHIDFY